MRCNSSVNVMTVLSDLTLSLHSLSCCTSFKSLYTVITFAFAGNSCCISDATAVSCTASTHILPVCAYTHTRIYTHTRTHTNKDKHTPTHTDKHTHTHTYTCFAALPSPPLPTPPPYLPPPLEFSTPNPKLVTIVSCHQ